jgi:hypothetical protein
MPAGTLQIYPNPNEGVFYIQPNFSKRTPLDGRLVSAEGKEISRFKWDNVLDQPFLVELNQKLVPGTYFWYFTSESKVATLPMIIQQP